MFTKNKKLKVGLKFVSLMTCLMFTGTNLASAADIAQVFAKPAVSSGMFQALTAKEISRWGTLKTSFAGKGDRMVIHIQDVHMNEDAQKNIAGLINYLAKSRGVKLINVEGASRELVHRPLSLYPDARARELVAGYFLKEGFLAGPEYAAITGNSGLRLFGIEDKALYEANRKVFLEALEYKKRNEQALSKLRVRMVKLGRYVFPEDFQKVTEGHNNFEDRRVKLTDHVRFLKEMSVRAGIAWQYPKLDLILEADDLEKQKKTIETRKKLRAAYKKLDIGIFDDISSVEKALTAVLLKTQEQKDLNGLFEFLSVCEKLFDFSLTREDAEFYYKNREKFESNKFRAILEPLFQKHHFDEEDFPIDEVRRDLEKIEMFYRLALERDAVLVSKTLENMRGAKEKISVAVTGGFHTAGVEKYLREKNISYAVLTPTLETQADERQEKALYARAMSGQETWFQKVLPDFGPQSVNDPAYQLQPPKMLPEISVQAGVEGAPSSVSFLRHAMIAVNIEGLRLSGKKLKKASIDNIFSKLLPSETALAAEVYPLVNHADSLIETDPSGSGTFLSPLPAGKKGSAIGAQWNRSKDRKSPEWQFKSRNEMVLETSDRFTVRVRAVGPEDYALAQASFKHGQTKRTAARSELRSVTSGNLRFRGYPLLDHEKKERDEAYLDEAFKNPAVMDQIKKAMTEFGVDVLAGGDFAIMVRAHSVLTDGRKTPRPEGDEKETMRVYKVMIHTPQGRLTFVYTVEGVKRQFRPYTLELNRLSNLMINSRKEGQPAGMKAVFAAAGVELPPYSTVFVQNTAPDTYSLRPETEAEAPVQIKIQKPEEVKKDIADEDRPADSFDSMFKGETFVISVILAPFKALEFLQKLLSRLKGGWSPSNGEKGRLAAFVKRLSKQAGVLGAAGELVGTRSEVRCGNASISGQVKSKADLETYLSRLSQSIMITEIRGKISMGFYVMMEDANGKKAIIHEKYMIRKRQQAQDAFADFSAKVRAAAARLSQPFNLTIGVHLRWPTAGGLDKDMYMEEIERGAHPHSWVGINAIAHNGDFDFLMHKGKRYTNEAVGWMLKRVLKKNNDTTGDSPKAAGMMDLFLAQGDWTSAARFSHFEAVTGGFEDYFGGTLPGNVAEEKTAPDTSLTAAEEKALGEFLRKSFEAHEGPAILASLKGKELSEIGQETLRKLKAAMTADVKEPFADTPAGALFKKWGAAKAKSFVGTAVEAYFKNNSFHVWKTIMPRFRGSAGINAYSPSSVNKLTAVSLVSPLSIGYGFKDGVIQFGSFSERKAAGVEGYQYIFDLDPLGEIVEVTHNGSEVTFKVFSIPQGRELSQEEITARIVPVKPFVPLTAKEKADPIEAEARKLPGNLAAIRREWDGLPSKEVPEPHNLKVAAEFMTALFRNPVGKRIVSGVRQNIERGYLNPAMEAWAKQIAEQYLVDHPELTGEAAAEVTEDFLAEILHREILALLTQPDFTEAVLAASHPISADLVSGKLKPEDLQSKIDDAVFILLNERLNGGRESLFPAAVERSLGKFKELDTPGFAADLKRAAASSGADAAETKKTGYARRSQEQYRLHHKYLKEIPRYETNGPDIVLYGKEKNEELFLEWIEFFKKLLPGMKVIFLEPNQILEEAERFTRDENDASKRLENMDVDGLRQRLGLTNPYLVALGAGESGQTFPAAVSTTLLVRLIPDVFVMTADIDSPMARDVGPLRTFLFRSTWSPAEVHVAATASARLTLLELGLHLTRNIVEKFPDEQLFGRKYEAEDLEEIEKQRDDLLASSVANITGYTPKGKLEKDDAQDHNKIAEEGKALGRRINEAVDVWVMAALYIFATVALPNLGIAIPPLFMGLNMLVSPLFALAGPLYIFAAAAIVIYSAAIAIYMGRKVLSISSKYPMPKRFFAKVFARSFTLTAIIGGMMFWPGLLDALLYIHLAGPVLPLVRRFVIKRWFDHNSRSVQDRMGFKKIIIISKNRGVANLLAIALRKMFNQAYGINGITIHSTDSYRALDEHSGDRSTWIILLNRDGRVPDAENTESAISMIGKQIKTILSLFFPFAHLFGIPLSGAYILNISSNPNGVPKAGHKHLAIDTETHDPKNISKRRIVQEIFGDSIDSFKQLLEGYVLITNMTREVAKPVWYKPWSYIVSWIWYRTHGGTGVHTTAQPYGADAILPYLQKMPKVLRSVGELPVPVVQTPLTAEIETAEDPLEEVDGNGDEALVPDEAVAVSTVEASEPEPVVVKKAPVTLYDELMNFLGPEEEGPARKSEVRMAQSGNTAAGFSESLGNALEGSTALDRQIQLAREFNFWQLDREAKELGFDLMGALGSFGSVLDSRLDPAKTVPAETGGDLILNYKASEHSDSFMRELYRKIAKSPEGVKLYVFRDSVTSQNDWMRLKSRQSTWAREAAGRIQLADRQQFKNLDELVEARLRARKVKKSDALQLLWPGLAGVKASDLKYVQAALLGAVPLAQSTVVIIGSEKPIAQVQALRGPEILRAIFMNHKLFAVSA